MKSKEILPFAVVAFLALAGATVAETVERADFRPLDIAEPQAPASPASPVKLKPSTLREVDQDGDSRVGFGELLEADFGGKS